MAKKEGEPHVPPEKEGRKLFVSALGHHRGLRKAPTSTSGFKDWNFTSRKPTFQRKKETKNWCRFLKTMPSG